MTEILILFLVQYQSTLSKLYVSFHHNFTDNKQNKIIKIVKSETVTHIH